MSSAQSLAGHVESRTFVGPVTGLQVNFNIYLPAGYDQSLERYPVIYHLHGIGGNQGGQQNTTVPASFESAKAQGIIGPVIVVFPNGYTDSWWADSVNSVKPADIDVMQQLIPHVDANFRTIASSGARVVEGFSMGGFGATKFYTKYPHMFAACVEYDGALVTWQTMLQFHTALAAEIFNNDQAYFNQYSPWSWSSVNVQLLKNKPPVRMIAGALVGGNQNFRNHLQALGIPVEYVATGCAHDIGCLYNAQGIASATFIAAHLDLSRHSPGDVNDDGVVNINDLVSVITSWGPCPAQPVPCPADDTGNGVVDIDDLVQVIVHWS
jgi:enterochelin esterase-like enzyme